MAQEMSLVTQGKHSKAEPKRLFKADHTIVTTEQFTESAQKGTAYLHFSPPRSIYNYLLSAVFYMFILFYNHNSGNIPIKCDKLKLIFLLLGIQIQDG